jgi:very-short-patch-repair endonuclease
MKKIYYFWFMNNSITNSSSPPSEGCQSERLDGVEQTPHATTNSIKETIIITHINSIPIKRNFIENLPFNPKLKQLVKDKRKAGILSEVLFWKQVHKGKFYNIDFDRQRNIGNFIVDFYIKSLGLVIEIDGSSHDNKVEYDALRQAYLENLGLRVYRISDIDVKKKINIVFEELERYIINEFEIK